MKNKQNSSKPIPTRKVIKGLLAIGIVSLLLFAGFWINFLRLDNKRAQTAILRGMILDAAEGLRKPVPVDAQSGQVYIHEVHLTLPEQGNRTQALYSYSKPENPGDFIEELNIVDVSAVRIAKPELNNAQNTDQLFAALPKFQACNRGYFLTFKPAPSYEDAPLIFSKKLKDGRTLYVSKENTCSTNSGTFVTYLKQIESY